MAARKPRTAAKPTTPAVDVTGRPIWPAGVELKPLPAQEPAPDEKPAGKPADEKTGEPA
jgi:hypothetical protein